MFAVSLLQLIYRAWASALTLPSPAHCQMTALVAAGAIAEWELMRNFQSSNRYCPLYAECLLFNIIHLKNVIKSKSPIYFVLKKLNTYEYMPETYMR